MIIKLVIEHTNSQSRVANDKRAQRPRSKNVQGEIPRPPRRTRDGRAAGGGLGMTRARTIARPRRDTLLKQQVKSDDWREEASDRAREDTLSGRPNPGVMHSPVSVSVRVRGEVELVGEAPKEYP